MAEEKYSFTPEVVLPHVRSWRKRLLELVGKRRKLVLGLLLITLAFFVLNLRKNVASNVNIQRGVNVKVGKSFDFPAISNQGKVTTNKIKFTLATAEKTNQVLVGDKTFTAKNNKMFLIVNLELKNDATTPLNIIPGDLVRLTHSSDEENKFAPDLHNNVVSIAPISTKLDRIGFVIPQENRDFKLYVGELEGKKETLEVVFPS